MTIQTMVKPSSPAQPRSSGRSFDGPARWFARLVLLALCWVAVQSPLYADWPQFRGPGGSSVAHGQQLPVELGADDLAWTAELPGQGVSGPIVVDGRVIVTCSSGYRERHLHVLCIDAASGQPLWHRRFLATGRTMCHPSTAVAAPTPASDGRRIVAFYSSNDLACLDIDGNLLWYRGLTFDHPTAANDVGMASSPLLLDDVVVVQMQSQGESFAAAIDAESGTTRWKVPLKNVACWTSPVGVPRDGGSPLVLVQSPVRLLAIDARRGTPVWQQRGPCASMASPVVAAQGMLVVPAAGLSALRPETSHAQRVWNSNRLAPGPASPIVVGDRVYVLNRAGILSAGELSSGKIVWRKRLKGTFWATPVVAGQHLYAVNQDGTILVVSLANKGEIVATHDLGESILASPAVADHAIYFRSDRHLWKFAAEAAR